MNDEQQKTDAPVTTAPSPSELAAPSQEAKNPEPVTAPEEEVAPPETAPTPELPEEKKESTPEKSALSRFPTFEKYLFHLSIKDKMLFARHMEMMTRSGLQVLEALEILRKQTQKPAFMRVLDTLIADVKNGHYLSVAMESGLRPATQPLL